MCLTTTITITTTIALSLQVLRAGMGQASGLHPSQQLDTVITNALIVDHTGECLFLSSSCVKLHLQHTDCATVLPLRLHTTTTQLNKLSFFIVSTGIYKSDVGIKNGRIVGIGQAGNPDCMDGVSDSMRCGVNTEAIAVSALPPVCVIVIFHLTVIHCSFLTG